MFYYKIDAAAPLQPPELGLTQFSFIRRVCNVPLCSFFFSQRLTALPPFNDSEDKQNKKLWFREGKK